MVPQRTLAKRRTIISILSLLMFLTHKNHKKSRSDSLTDTFKNACLMSLISVALYEKILLKYQLILEVDSVLFPGIDLVTAFLLMTMCRKQYVF